MAVSVLGNGDKFGCLVVLFIRWRNTQPAALLLDETNTVSTVYTHDNRNSQSVQIWKLPSSSIAEGIQAFLEDR